MSITHIAFYPSDWLAGTRGMSAEETGVYITLIARMYENAGPIERDDERLARLCGCKSKAAFKKALQYLIDEGKIQENDQVLTNNRVEREIQIATTKSDTARAKANTRWSKKSNKNNVGRYAVADAAADAEPPPQHMPDGMQKSCYPEPEPDIGGGGGSARAREADFSDPDPPPDDPPKSTDKDPDPPVDAGRVATFHPPSVPARPTGRDRLLEAMGVGPDGVIRTGPMAVSGKIIGGASDMQEARRWKADLGLTVNEMVEVVVEVMASRKDTGPPANFRYFTAAMQRYAGQKSEPKLAPIPGEQHGQRRSHPAGKIPFGRGEQTSIASVVARRRLGDQT